MLCAPLLNLFGLFKAGRAAASPGEGPPLAFRFVSFLRKLRPTGRVPLFPLSRVRHAEEVSLETDVGISFPLSISESEPTAELDSGNKTLASGHWLSSG